MVRCFKLITYIMVFLVAGSFSATFAYGETEQQTTVSVIFTHDMHSHMDTDRAEKDGSIIEVGGFAKLKTAMDRVKTKYPDSFVLDAGDFSMGTPYQTIFSQEASELRMMEYLGYEATTLGNHEFDYRALGLASMLDVAKDVDVQMLIANIDWEATLADKELAADAKVLREACDAYGVKPYTVLDHNGVKAAVFGLMGENAVEYAPESGLIFKNAVEAAVDVVDQIKQEENVDIIICLSHCGTIENEEDAMEETEDYLLAEAVSDIDLIISGHSHTVLEEAVQVGDTYIVSCGAYNAYMGHAVLERKEVGDEMTDGANTDANAGANDDSNALGGYDLVSYELIPLDDTVAGNPAVDVELGKYRTLVNLGYFNDYGYDVDQVIASNDVGFAAIDEFGLEQGEEPLGNLIADSYHYALEQAGQEADVTIVPHGVIRGSFLEGDITVGDAFNVSSLGYGKDGLAGYPLVKAYLTGKELKTIAEVDVSISDFMGVARLYCSGLEYSWNPNRLILNRAVDVKFRHGGTPADDRTGSQGESSDESDAEPLEDDRLYSVVADLYSCQMLGSVKEKSFGLLKIEPKDADGNPIENYEDHIIYDGDRELKAWYALASYIDSFEGDKVPDYYGQTHGRKIEIDSLNPVELLKQPNKIAGLVAAAIAVAVLVVVGLVVPVRKLMRRRKPVR